ncbi:MAG TPA: hypothetical protein VGH42_12795 [Verrucomicrobiae bacterium]
MDYFERNNLPFEWKGQTATTGKKPMAAFPSKPIKLAFHPLQLPVHLADVPEHLASLPTHTAYRAVQISTLPGHLALRPVHFGRLPLSLARVPEHFIIIFERFPLFVRVSSWSFKIPKQL